MQISYTNLLTYKNYYKSNKLKNKADIKNFKLKPYFPGLLFFNKNYAKLKWQNIFDSFLNLYSVNTVHTKIWNYTRGFNMFKKRWTVTLLNSTMNPKLIINTDHKKFFSLGILLKLFKIDNKKYRRSKKYHKILLLYLKSYLNIDLTNKNTQRQDRIIYFVNLGFYNTLSLLKKIIQLWFFAFSFRSYYFINKTNTTNLFSFTKVKAIKKRLKKRFVKQYFRF